MGNIVVRVEGSAIAINTKKIGRLFKQRPSSTIYADKLMLGIQPQLTDASSSSPRELPPQALTEPDVNVSAHPAPIVQPLHTTISNEQTDRVVFVQYVLPTALLAFDGCVNVCIF